MYTTNKNRYTTVVQKSPEAQALKLTFRGGGVDMFPVDCSRHSDSREKRKEYWNGAENKNKTKRRKKERRANKGTRCCCPVLHTLPRYLNRWNRLSYQYNFHFHTRKLYTMYTSTAVSFWKVMLKTKRSLKCLYGIYMMYMEVQAVCT